MPSSSFSSEAKSLRRRRRRRRHNQYTMSNDISVAAARDCAENYDNVSDRQLSNNNRIVGVMHKTRKEEEKKKDRGR